MKLPSYYIGIDFLPILNWHKIISTGDIVHLLIKPCKITIEQKKELQVIWKGIYSEYLKAFGYSDDFKRIFEKRFAILKLQEKYIKSKDNSVMNFIKRREKELKILLDRQSVKGGDVYSMKIEIEKYMKFHLPLAGTSVREFYGYINDMKKQPKTLNK